jgi:hypothetical protein
MNGSATEAREDEGGNNEIALLSFSRLFPQVE